MCKVANGMSLRTISEVFQLSEKSYHSKHHKSQLTVTVISNLSCCFFCNNRKFVSYKENIWEIVPPTVRQRNCLSGFNKLSKFTYL